MGNPLSLAYVMAIYTCTTSKADKMCMLSAYT